MSWVMNTVKSARRQRFEADTFPHLEALWRTALALTMRLSYAEDLVLRTMTKAYPTWHGSVDTVGSKTRLFRILAREFSGAGNRRNQPGQFLHENGKTGANNGDSGRQYGVPSIDPRELLLVSRISDVSAKGAIARLRPESRLIMLLLMRERFSHADIAYITDLRKDSVKSIFGRLRRLIPRYLIQRADCSVTAADSRTALQVQGVSSDGGRSGR